MAPHRSMDRSGFGWGWERHARSLVMAVQRRAIPWVARKFLRRFNTFDLEVIVKETTPPGKNQNSSRKGLPKNSMLTCQRLIRLNESDQEGERSYLQVMCDLPLHQPWR